MLLVTGEHDFPDFRAVAERLPGRHVHLDWAGRLPSLEDPEPVNALLLEFLPGRSR